MKSISQIIQIYISKGEEFTFMKRISYVHNLKDIPISDLNYVLDRYNEYIGCYKEKYVAKFKSLLDYVEYLTAKEKLRIKKYSG